MRIVVQKPTTEQLQELGVLTWDTWGCEASTFDWYYDEQETCYLLEGKVTVKTDSQEVSFKQGDLVIFPAGLSCVWIVHEQVKKHYKFG